MAGSAQRGKMGAVSDHSSPILTGGGQRWGGEWADRMGVPSQDSSTRAEPLREAAPAGSTPSPHPAQPGQPPGHCCCPRGDPRPPQAQSPAGPGGAERAGSGPGGGREAGREGVEGRAPGGGTGRRPALIHCNKLFPSRHGSVIAARAAVGAGVGAAAGATAAERG